MIGLCPHDRHAQFPRSPDERFESGEHMPRAWSFEGRTFGDESVLHIDDDQGATSRIDGEEIFSSDAWVGHWDPRICDEQTRILQRLPGFLGNSLQSRLHLLTADLV